MNFLEFNPDSIRMYEVPGSVTKDGSSICGQNCKLSENDKWFITKLYPGVASMLTAIPQQSAEPISTGQEYIITNFKCKNAAFLEGALHKKTSAKYASSTRSRIAQSL
jgi:hypothetical protein